MFLLTILLFAAVFCFLGYEIISLIKKICSARDSNSDS